MSTLHWADYCVIAAYFIFVLIVGLWSSHRSARDSVAGYFLASRSMNWILVGASLFASNIGSGHFIGLAGSAAAGGVAIAGFELNAVFILMLLGWIYIPVYMAAGVFTMPKYLQKRFGGQRIQIYLSVLALLLYVFTKISADLYAGALFIKLAMGFEGQEGIYIAILILLAIAAVFTIAGGLTAVIWTDFVQTILMLVGAFILMAMAFYEVGGYNQLMYKYFQSIPQNMSYSLDNKPCTTPRSDSMSLLRDVNADLPWTGLIFGLTISAVWYWCSDQVIVQRALAAKNVTHAKAGCIFAGILKILPLYLLVFPGMVARVLYVNRVACSLPEECEKICGSPSGCSNIAYAEMVIKLMPTGLSGLMLAVMLAALMSSLTSIFNSSSTIFTMDIWTRIRKNASEMELLIIGRLFVLCLVVISVMWIPIIQSAAASQLFVYIQSVTSYLSPPVAAVYVLAIFWDRINEKGAFWGLMAGLVIGLIRFGLEFGYTIPACGSGDADPRPDFVKQAVGSIHYLHFGCILFLISAAVTVVISLLTEPIPKENLYRLTFWTRHSMEVREEATNKEQISTGKKDELPTNDLPSLMKTEPDIALPVWRRILNFLCGIDVKKPSTEKPPKKKTKEEEAREAAEFLKEDTFWRRIVNASAILVMTIAVFVWAFYA